MPTMTGIQLVTFFTQYFSEDSFVKIAFYTHLRVVQESGGIQSANTTPKEMKKDFDVCIVMACLNTPESARTGALRQEFHA